ncbi:MAG: hypothetical protein II999_05175 [Bacteroidaceae bacterium]|nr:hypothetical protein [Bacteroidaceae bacterium]
MIKKLLSAAFFAGVALSANAYEVNDFVYSKTAKYQITGQNLVVNGQFKEGETGLTGWDTVSINQPLSATFTKLTAGPNGSNTQQVLPGSTSLEHGMRQNIHVATPGTYVVSLSVKGSIAGFTDHDLTGGNTNYINAYYNTDQALAWMDTETDANNNGKKDDYNLRYGENGVCNAYQFSFADTAFTEVTFPVEVPAEGYIILDFRGLNEGLEIADVECHMAEEVYDDRVAKDRIAYFQSYLNSEGIDERMYFAEFQECVKAVEAGIEANSSPVEMASLMENLEMVWDLFVSQNFDNVIDYIATKDGSASTGNNSANWMKWTAKWNKLSNDYKNQAPWSWSTDRWCHKTAAADSPMSLQWMRGAGANDNWNNIATLTTTLRPGKYYWGVTGQGGMMTLNKNRWARSWADECAETKLFFNGDTVFVGILNAARNQDYVVEFILEEEKEVTLGLICNNVSTSASAGFDVNFISPVLYRFLNEGELTAEQEAYLNNVEAQLTALQGRLEVANGYVAEDQKERPWGKEALKEGVAEAQTRYDGWMAMSQDDVLKELAEERSLPDTIMNNGVRFLNNNYITPFENMNKPFTDMPGAIEAAQETLGQRIYESSSKKEALAAEITASQNMYNEKLTVPFSSADSLALVDQREALNALVEEFKLAIDATTIVDIDFGTQEAPAQFTIITETDTEGVTNYTSTIVGTKGTMVFTNAKGGTAEDGTEITGGSQPFELGYNATDSLGMLRVGNGEASVEIAGAPVKATDIVNIKFDLYTGNLSGKKVGFKVLTAESDTICGLFYSAYSGNDDLNTFNINYGALPKVGSSGNDNGKVSASSNKTSFDVVIDYGAKMMYCTTSSSKGVVTSETIALTKGAPAKFVLYSNYNNDSRRSWFDNLKVLNIAAGEYDSVEAIEVVKPVANGAMYNLMGQQIKRAAKGQIYIQNGQKKIGK